MSDEEARAWLESAHMILFPTSDGTTASRAILAARAELARLRERLERAGVNPAVIVDEARVLLAERGQLEKVEWFASGPHKAV
jgi:hypothetical protein